MVKVARYIQDLHPHIVAGGCAAYGTQLLFKRLSTEPSVEEAHMRHLDIIAYLRVPDQYLRLLQKQRDGDRAGRPVLMLIQPDDTRWLSNVDSLRAHSPAVAVHRSDRCRSNPRTQARWDALRC
jgi:hypothetical protein